MQSADWIPPGVDINAPSIARVYDYWLGGSHNFAADREAARIGLEQFPDALPAVYDIRAFLRRAVEFLVAEGVTQFLDIGSGIPTAGNVHQIAQTANPDARIVYVDIDPIAVAHSRAILKNNDRTAAIQGDVRQPAHILDHPDTRRLLDFGEPVGLLMCAVLHFVTDDEKPAALVAQYRDALPSGSHLALSHSSMDDPAVRERFERSNAVYERMVSTTVPRTKDAVLDLFDGFDLVDPGLVWVPDWRPEPESPSAEFAVAYGGVGRKR